jgi:hypothetical protein
MKKIMAFIFATVLILNLLPQTSDAFRLNEDNNSVIYDAFKEEKEEWETFYLPHAKHFKIVSKNTTMLDIAKIAQAEQEKNVSAYTIIHKIMDITEHTRCKLLVKWELDNGYIDEEAETRHKITPTVRRELLKEIEEEEQKERERANQFLWETAKTGVMFGSTITAFIVSIFLKKDIDTSASKATLAFIATSAVVSGAEFSTKIYNKHKKDKEEIKIPPLRNTDSRLPKNYKRVDLYSL